MTPFSACWVGGVRNGNGEGQQALDSSSRVHSWRRTSLVSAQEPRKNAKEVGPRFNVLLLERGVTTAPSDSLLPGGFLAANVSLSTRNDDFQGAPDDGLREPNIPGVAMAFSGNVSMPSNGPPVTMSHIRTPTMHYSGP